MKSRFFSLSASSDGINLSVASFEPEKIEDAKGIIQLVHGMVEHKERYNPLIEFLVDNGYICVIHDHRGHGASVNEENELGYMGKGGWRAMVEDVKIVGDWARETYGKKEFTMFGHSMGSMVVRSYIKRYDSTIDRLFVCGCPSDNPAKGLGRALAWVMGTVGGWHRRPELLQKISFSGYNNRFKDEEKEFSKAWVCSERKILEEYHKDPLCSFIFTSNGFYNLFSLMADCYDAKGWAVANPALPIHFISGAEDPCRRSDEAFHSAAEFLRDRGYTLVTEKLYPGMRHQIHTETDKDIVWNDIIARLAE